MSVALGWLRIDDDAAAPPPAHMAGNIAPPAPCTCQLLLKPVWCLQKLPSRARADDDDNDDNDDDCDDVYVGGNC